jgi:hypothetical protein
VLTEHNKSIDDNAFASIFNSARVRLTSNHIRARLLAPNSGDEPASAIFIGARNNDIVVQKNKVESASGNGIDITNTGPGSAGTARTSRPGPEHLDRERRRHLPAARPL